MSWRRIKLLFTHNWKEKCLALLLALLFWFMIKAQANRSASQHHWGVPPSSRMEVELP